MRTRRIFMPPNVNRIFMPPHNWYSFYRVRKMGSRRRLGIGRFETRRSER